MKLLCFVLFLCCKIFDSTLCEKSLSTIEVEQFIKIIETFSKQFDGNLCANTLLQMSQQSSTFNNPHNLLDLWSLTTPRELYSLNFYNLVSDDTKCRWKVNGPVNQDRYCMYEIYNESLTDGFLLTICIPPSCNEADVEILGNLAHDQVRKEKHFGNNAQVQCGRKNAITASDKFGLFVVGMIIIALSIVTISSTILYEINKRKESDGSVYLSNKWKKMVSIFADQVNFRNLLSSNSKTEINILHPIRVLCMMIMIFCHVHEIAMVFAKNADDFRNSKGIFWLWNNGTTFVGTFFVIGGTLTTYVTLCKFVKHSFPKIKEDESFYVTFRTAIGEWSIMILNRYIRLIPLYIFFVLLFTYVMQHLVFFIPFVNFDPLSQCPPRIFNLLFMVSNFDYRPYCMLWAWYLDVDFQLYILCRPLVWLFVHKPFWAFVTSFGLITGSTMIRVLLRSWYNLSPAMSFIMQFPGYNSDYLLNNLVIYTKPYTWLSSYVVGMLVGYIAYFLRFKRPLTKLNPIIQSCFWICSISFFLWGFFGIYWNANGFKNDTYDGFYIAFSPLLWAVASGWIIIHSHIFISSTRLQEFYQWKIFTFLSNLSLGCCLINFPIGYFILKLYAFVGYNGDPKFYMSTPLLFAFFALTLIFTYILAFLLYLIVEGPASRIRFSVPTKQNKSETKSE